MVSTITDRVYGESSGVAVKAPCLAVTTTPNALSGLGAIGSYTPQPGDRILVAAQTDPTTNGIYNASTGAWARSGDFDGAYDCVQGTLIVVYYANTQGLIYQLTTPSPVIGTSPLIFVPFANLVVPYPQTLAEIVAGVTPSNENYPQGDVRRYGAVAGVDGTAALIDACLVGADVIIPIALSVASASLAAAGPFNAVSVFSNTTFRFPYDGSITVTGTTPCNVFYSLNQTNIRFVEPVVTGNGSAATSTTGYFWYCQANAAATANMSSLKVRGGTLTNFAGYYWVYFDNFAGTTYRMQDMRVEGVTFISQPGACQGPANVSITAAMVGFSGSDTVNYYGIQFARVKDCTLLGQYVKTLCVFWSGVQQARASGNICYSVSSDASFSNDVASYVLFAYDHSHGAAAAPDLIEFFDNEINGCRDAGIYLSAVTRVYCRGNVTVGQTSTVDGTIPKGGIAINQCVLAKLEDNSFDACAYSLSMVVGTGGTIIANDTTVTGIPAGDTGVKVAVSGAGTLGKVIMDGLVVDSATGNAALLLNSTSTVGIQTFVLRNFRINMPINGLIQFSPDSTVPAIGSAHISNGEFANIGNQAIEWTNCSNAATRAVFESIQFTTPAAGADLFNLTNSTGLTVRDITFNDMTSGAGFCWLASGAQGRLEGMRFVNVAVANRNEGGDLGTALPTGWGADDDFVQNIVPTELGSSGSKYMVTNWMYDAPNAAWKACRSLTGN